MLTIGRIFAGNGWRYLWDQVAGDGADYYLLDVGRGETPGRWGGTVADAELGLVGRVSEEQMRRTFGRLAHPVTEVPLGRPPLTFRSVDERLSAARPVHDRNETARWALRELALLDAGASQERIDGELQAFRAGAAEHWTAREATIRRGGHRQAVSGFDLTFSAPKSVSVLWAAAPAGSRQKIWDAHHEGVAEAMRFIEREAALSRTGYSGVRQVDTTGLITASFDHRMSRAGDVHLHTHTATLNRVRCGDGAWRALDGRALYRVAAAAGAIYDRVRETALERDLGVRHELDAVSGAREIVGVDAGVRRLFSARRVQIEGRLGELVAQWRAEHGSDPSEWMVTRMAEWARLETRAPKGPGETTGDALARWDTQARTGLGRSFAQIWAAATTQSAAGRPDPAHSPAADRQASARPSGEFVVAAAVRAVDEAKSTWTRYDLAREVTRRLDVDPVESTDLVLARVDALVAAALDPASRWGVISLAAPAVFTSPPSLRRTSDDTSVYVEHGADRYTTNTGLALEHRLLAAARDTTGPRLDPTDIDSALTGCGLDGDQAGAVAAVAGSGRRLDALVGPAGTGKTTTMGALAHAWTSTGRQVLGVSIAENATRTLANTAGIPAVNAAKLIFEHTHRSPHQRRQRRWQDNYSISPGALVILDEAGMASRQTIDRLASICAHVGAKLLLVGDPEQLPSPDAGGAFELIATHTGATTLGQVRRFTHPWERAASLRLRAGDPTVLDAYHQRGRISGGTQAEMEDAALAAVLADRARGLDSFLLADTNDTVARVARHVRDRLVATGKVDDSLTVTLADGNRAGVGDRIVTRHNDRTTRSDDGRFVANRDQWTIQTVTQSGGLTVTRTDTTQTGTAHPVELDAAYAGQRVELGYASTLHAVQGGTADTAHVVLTPRSTRTSAHVGLTRGRHENHAYVVCARPEGADSDGPAHDPLAVLAAILQRPVPPDAVAALQVQTDQTTRATSLATLYPIWQDLLAHHGTRDAEQTLAVLVGADFAEATVHSPAWPALAARLRRLHHAGIDPAAALTAAATQDSLDDATDLAAVLHWRLRHTETATTNPAVTFTTLTPAGPGDLPTTARQIAAAMDTQTAVLARHVETNPPDWAHHLGPQPADRAGQQAWSARAGVVAGYRQAFAVTTTDDPIGPAPPPDPVDAYAWWARAAAALTTNPAPTLNALPTEQLEAIIDHAHTHQTAAPPAVADQLRAAALALRAAQTRAGTALNVADRPTAAVAEAEARRLARELDRLETAQARRERWDHVTGRLEHQAAAAQTILDDRHAADQARPHWRVDTATLIAHLRAAQRRATQAAATAERYDHQATRTTAAIGALTVDIRHTAILRPAETQARQTILAEQDAAARIDTINTALNATRLGYHTVRGSRRAHLTTELHHLHQKHPALTVSADPARRWDTLLAHAQAADRDTLDQLRADHHQATIDLDWYQGTATSLRTDNEQQHTTITNIRTELTTRTGAPRPPQPASSSPHHPRFSPRPPVAPQAAAHEQVAPSAEPTQDTPKA